VSRFRLRSRLNTLTLRQRFLVAPLFALALFGTLMAGFVYESERQNALLTRIAEREFTDFELYSDVFVELSAQHLGLYALLSDPGKTSEEVIYDKAKERLYAIHAAIGKIESALASGASGAVESLNLRRELLALTYAYRRSVTSAVEMSTVNLALAPTQIAIANERFIAMNRAFNQLLKLQRQALSSEIGHRVEQTHMENFAFGLAGMAGAICVLVLSLLLSRLLAGSLEKQIDVLSELGGPMQAGEDSRDANELERMGHAITSFKEAAERVTYLAHYDSLTNLPNRTLFRDRLVQAMARTRRSERIVAVMLLDLDRFKEINDTLGHTAGDDALRQVAGILTVLLREVDTIARLGGDEFAIVVEQTSVEQLSSIADRIQHAFSEPLVVQGREFFVTTSIGIALHPEHGRDVDELVQRADIALYRAKDEGRNTYQIYSGDMNAQADERMTMDRLLRRALERREFVLHYQPKVSVSTGSIVGVEALIRWRSEELGMVSPADFIPLAEETGLIVPISAWVLHTACTQVKAWQDAGLPPLLMSVNLSPRQFRQKDLVETIAAALRETGLEARYLDLEITEGTVMHHADKAIAILNELNALGVQLSVDDFGTGYSSLSYLKRFPVQRLKIDQSFVRGVTSDPNDAAIVTAVVAMAKNLKLKLVAEGVETEEQRAFLDTLDCDEYQGFYFSKPVPPEDFVRLLTAGLAATAKAV
jgi:diguanylate cyclase (GGDEF)-like protein